MEPRFRALVLYLALAIGPHTAGIREVQLVGPAFARFNGTIVFANSPKMGRAI